MERAKRIAQRADVLVAPILLPGQSPYHMEFAGTVTLSSTLIQEVYVEAAKSLMHHGFKRFLVLNAHGGNRAITTFIVDRINQETEGIAVDLNAVSGPFMVRGARRGRRERGCGVHRAMERTQATRHGAVASGVTHASAATLSPSCQLRSDPPGGTVSR